MPVAGIHVSERAEIFALTNIRRCGEKEEEMLMYLETMREM